MRANEFITEETIQLASNQKAKDWIEKVYAKYPTTWQNNHVMLWGEGENQQMAVFELTPSFSKRGAVEVKWFQAYPLRQGVGSRAMQELQNLAREDGISLTLYPWDKGQVSQAKLSKFYKGHGFKPVQKGGKSLAWEPELEEGWKDWVAGAAMGAAALGAQAAPKHHVSATQPAHVHKVAAHKVAHVAPKTTVAAPVAQLPKITPEQSRAGQTPAELKAYVEAMAQKYLPSNQVAQFVGQVAHETANFTSMIEQNPEKNLKHYAKPKNPLGNKGMEDAQKYIGRGFLQITGKYNYKHFGDMIRPGLGDELLKNPNLAMRKDVAIALAIMFWRERVAPKMAAGASHKEIATAINGRKPKGLDSRMQAVKVAAANMLKPRKG